MPLVVGRRHATVVGVAGILLVVGLLLLWGVVLVVAVGCCVLLLVAFAAGPAFVVVFDARAFVVCEAVFAFAAGGGAECVQLGVEGALRFDEAAAVVAHGLVAGIWVLGCDCDY